jgi:hypothetical protein
LDIDLSNYAINGLSYNLNLNEVGHEYDGVISTGVKVVAAVAAVAAVASTGGGALAAEAGTAATVSTATSIADTVTDIGSMIYTEKLISSNENQCNGQVVESKKGIIESIVGAVTDKTLGKPQRQRKLHEYMDTILLPGFKSRIKCITTDLINVIGTLLRQEASNSIAEMSRVLNELQKARKEKKEEYDKRISLLRNYKNEILAM